MKSRNHPIETENHLNQTSIFGFHNNFLEGNLGKLRTPKPDFKAFSKDPRYKLPKRMNQWGPMLIFQGVTHLVSGFSPTHLKKICERQNWVHLPQVYRGEKKNKSIF